MIKDFGQEGEEYAMFLIKKGEVEASFGRLQIGVEFMNQGLELLIETKCKQKEKVMNVYLKAAEIYRKL